MLLVFLSAAGFLSMTVWLMLGPLLVELATAFYTSVAVMGQLTAVTAVTWALTACLAGPVSDTYGRRCMLLTGLMLMALGTLSTAYAWNYRALLACRCLTGVGAAMVPSNCLATVADALPLDRRGMAMGWLSSATGLGMAFGIPLVALLTQLGGWRLPFYVIGLALLLLWGLLWVWCPRHQPQAGHAVPFIAHFRAVGVKAALWGVLVANGLRVMTLLGMFSYLVPYLTHTYRLSAGDTALPLTVAGLGSIIGSLIGGRVASQASRLVVVTIACIGGGLSATLVFTMDISLWATVMLACGVAGLLSLAWTVMAVLVTEVAGQSQATATGLLTVSNQLGAVGGASLGGVMLSLGSFPAVGLFCLATAATAAVVVRYKVQTAVEFHQSCTPTCAGYRGSR
jgi:predicted MFS family arabinose efflux permease